MAATVAKCASWEGFVIENLIAAAPFGTDAWFYRTRAGAEIDLMLHLPDRRLWAVEVKRSTAPRAGKGFEIAASDIGADERFVVHPGREPFPLSADHDRGPSRGPDDAPRGRRLSRERGRHAFRDAAEGGPPFIGARGLRRTWSARGTVRPVPGLMAAHLYGNMVT